MKMSQNYAEPLRKLSKNTNLPFLEFAYYEVYCVKYARIRVFSDPYFPDVLVRENTGQRKPVFCHILRKGF